jgi:excisionase family DNA binding protein
MKTSEGDEMLTRKEAAEYLGCTVSLLNKIAWIDPQMLPFTKVGRGSRYRQSDLDDYRNRKLQGAK